MPRKYKHLTLEQRKEIKALRDNHVSVSEIANRLDKNINTIYRELNRGNDGNCYNPEYADSLYRSRLNHKGPPSFAIQHPDLAQFISKCIIEKNLSPETISKIVSSDPSFSNIRISKTTIYNAIDSGLIPNVTRESLRVDSVKMFSSGHIIIPLWIREIFGYRDGDSFIVSVSDDGSILLSRKQINK